MTLDPKWEKFRGGPSKGRHRSATEVYVTINRKGDLYFNSRAYEFFGRPKAVALYYSREDDAIAVQPAYPRFVENFPVVKKQMGHAVHAASFCRHWKIRIPNTERFLQPTLDNEGNLILNLRETITVGGITRGPKRV